MYRMRGMLSRRTISLGSSRTVVRRKRRKGSGGLGRGRAGKRGQEGGE
jgi:hypothetical protein